MSGMPSDSESSEIKFSVNSVTRSYLPDSQTKVRFYGSLLSHLRVMESEAFTSFITFARLVIEIPSVMGFSHL